MKILGYMIVTERGSFVQFKTFTDRIPVAEESRMWDLSFSNESRIRNFGMKSDAEAHVLLCGNTFGLLKVEPITIKV